MAVLVLNPSQNSILGHPKNLSPAEFIEFTLNRNLIAKASTNHHARKNPRKRIPNTSPPTSRATTINNNNGTYEAVKKKAPKLGLGQARILKRGEKVVDSELASKTKSPTEAKEVSVGIELASTNVQVEKLIASESEGDVNLPSVEKLIEDEQLLLYPRNLYAGLALFTSPIPSSLPIPSFFTSKKPEKTL